MDFPKKRNLKPGAFLLSFSMLLVRSCTQASNASPNLENPFFQNVNPPYGKSSHSVREKPLRYGIRMS